MPLSEKARIEAYIPDLPSDSYQKLIETLEQEFTYTFGGCTLVRNLSGSYQSHLGLPIQDRLNLIYTDAPFTHNEEWLLLSRYTDILRQIAFKALEEEAVLIAVLKVYHSE